MNIDNLSKRQEQHLLKLHVRINQSYRRTEETVAHYRHRETKNNRPQVIPPPYTPVKSSDMCLDKLLATHPQFKYEGRD